MKLFQHNTFHITRRVEKTTLSTELGVGLGFTGITNHDNDTEGRHTCMT